MFKYLRQFLCLAVALNFMVMISGVHGVDLTDHNHVQSESSKNCQHQESKQSSSDCPCPFHAKGVISAPLSISVDFSFLYLLSQQPLDLKDIFISTEASFAWISRAPPHSFI